MLLLATAILAYQNEVLQVQQVPLAPRDQQGLKVIPVLRVPQEQVLLDLPVPQELQVPLVLPGHREQELQVQQDQAVLPVLLAPPALAELPVLA
jgi:hypothetical protein